MRTRRRDTSVTLVGHHGNGGPTQALLGHRSHSRDGVGHQPRAGAATSLKAKLSTDGGARGNPGPAAYGYVLETENGTVLDARGEAIGVATNNVAEYSALIAGLAKAVELGVDELEVVSDSELLVRQMTGEYKVKNDALRDLNDEAQALERKLGRVRYTAVRREHNELADKLVNDALDAEEPG